LCWSWGWKKKKTTKVQELEPALVCWSWRAVVDGGVALFLVVASAPRCLGLAVLCETGVTFISLSARNGPGGPATLACADRYKK
jgi:hypothetical protein